MFDIRPASSLSPEARRQALALQFAEFPRAGCQTRVERGLLALDQGQIDSRCFLTCWISGRLAGSLICELLPGRAANLWPIRTAADCQGLGVEDALMAVAHEIVESSDAKFVQSLMPPNETEGIQALCRQGFQRATLILNMRCELPHTGHEIASNRLRMDSGSTDAAALQRLIVSTFEQSLDCPELNGIRTPDDIYAGYRAGTPAPSRWWLAWENTEAVGILIVADGASPRLLDLAYLGVLPGSRRRGIGREMLAHVLHIAKTSGADGMTLLVDERNQPAIQLYEQFGFRTFDRRELLLKVKSPVE
jgi:mycothiol synthase